VVTVPEGKQLVITNVSLLAFVKERQMLLAQVETKYYDAVQHTLVVSRQGVLEGAEYYAANHCTSIYADSSSVVTAIAMRSSLREHGQIDIAFSGYFIDVP
jgi:hypothetical protein